MSSAPNNTFRHIFVISGPSGAGKAAVMEGILRTTSLRKVVTYATRPKRPSERDGVDYNFVSKPQFDDLATEGEIVEMVQVYNDYFYGSPRLRYDADGPDRLIELDPNGRERYVAAQGPHLTTIFLLPPSMEALRLRIEARHRETNLPERLSAAAKQIGRASEYDYIVKNDILADACAIVTAIVQARQQQLLRDSLLVFADDLLRQCERSPGDDER